MFLLAFIVIALPGALIVVVAAAFAVHWFRLTPPALSFSWLFIPTFGLAAGGALTALVIEQFVLRPFELQNELIGGQLVTPLALRSYQFWGGFGDTGWTWLYAVDATVASQLARRCRPDPPYPRRECADTFNEERTAYIRIEGTTVRIQESFP